MQVNLLILEIKNIFYIFKGIKKKKDMWQRLYVAL